MYEHVIFYCSWIWWIPVFGVAFCQSVSDVSWGCENPDLSWWAEGAGWVYNWQYAVFTGLVLWHLHIQVFPKMGTTETIGFPINDDKIWMMFGYLTSGHPRSKNSHYFKDSKMDFLGPSVHRHFMIPHTASKKVKGGWLENPHLVRWFSHVFLPMKSVGISPACRFWYQATGVRLEDAHLAWGHFGLLCVLLLVSRGPWLFIKTF